jgi:hypothetical protein
MDVKFKWYENAKIAIESMFCALGLMCQALYRWAIYGYPNAKEFLDDKLMFIKADTVRLKHRKEQLLKERKAKLASTKRRLDAKKKLLDQIRKEEQKYTYYGRN